MDLVKVPLKRDRVFPEERHETEDFHAGRIHLCGIEEEVCM